LWPRVVDPPSGLGQARSVAAALVRLPVLGTIQQRRVFDRLGPESGRVMFELFFWIFDDNQTTKIDYEAITCPILMGSGSDDLAIPPSTARLIAERHGPRVSFHEAHGFGHYLTLEPEWQTIAEVCVAWMTKHKATVQ
jgi:non-heme chloroperoxidase